MQQFEDIYLFRELCRNFSTVNEILTLRLVCKRWNAILLGNSKDINKTYSNLQHIIKYYFTPVWNEQYSFKRYDLMKCSFFLKLKEKIKENYKNDNTKKNFYTFCFKHQILTIHNPIKNMAAMLKPVGKLIEGAEIDLKVENSEKISSLRVKPGDHICYYTGEEGKSILHHGLVVYPAYILDSYIPYVIDLSPGKESYRKLPIDEWLPEKKDCFKVIYKEGSAKPVKDSIQKAEWFYKYNRRKREKGENIDFKWGLFNQCDHFVYNCKTDSVLEDSQLNQVIDIIALGVKSIVKNYQSQKRNSSKFNA